MNKVKGQSSGFKNFFDKASGVFINYIRYDILAVIQF